MIATTALPGGRFRASTADMTAPTSKKEARRSLTLRRASEGLRGQVQNLYLASTPKVRRSGRPSNTRELYWLNGKPGAWVEP